MGILQLTTWEIAAAVVACIALVLLAIVCLCVIQTLSMCRFRMSPVEDVEIDKIIKKDFIVQTTSDEEPVEAMPGGAYKVNDLAFVFTGRFGSECRAICSWIGPGPSTSLITRFSGDVLLITSDRNSLHEFPSPPKQFFQSYHKSDSIFEHHLEAEECIQKYLGVSPIAFEEPDDKWVVEMIRERARHVRSIPFWYAQIAYWAFFRRGRLDGLSIEEQHQRGIMDLVKAKRELRIGADGP